MAKKSDKKRNILTLRLKVEPYQEHILEKRLNICRMIYNSMVNVIKKQINKLNHDLEYKQEMKNLINIKEELDKINKEINKSSLDKINIKELKSKQTEIKIEYNKISKKLDNLRKKYYLTEYDMYKLITPIYKKYNCHIQSHIAQDISLRVWKAVDKYLFKEGKTIHYKKYGDYHSLTSTDDEQIIFKGDYIQFHEHSNKKKIKLKNDASKDKKQKSIDKKQLNDKFKLKLKIHYNKKQNTEYEKLFLENVKIVQNRIKRKFIKNKYVYYVDIVYEGTPISIHKKGNTLGNGNIGIDIGTQTIAYTTDNEVKLLELANKVQDIEIEKHNIQRYMDRSRRSMNPNNFNEDGTIKKQGRKKVKWEYSKKYIKAKNKLKNILRKQADIRTLQHWELANHIVKQGNIINIEKMNFSALQKRSKKTTINKKTGKYNSKKRFGKSLANKAPAKFIEILNYKISSLGGILNKCDTKELKASQYNHIENKFIKKDLNNRWNKLNYKDQNILIQRDLYSAYLLKYVNEDLNTYNKEMLNNNFDRFIELYNKEIKRIKSTKLTKALTNIL